MSKCLNFNLIFNKIKASFLKSMSEVDLIATEQCGSTGEIVTFIKRKNKIVQVTPHRSFLHNFRGIASFFKEILLPYGYPESVSEDYLEYQIWDTLQAFCSTIIGAFTTRAVLKGVGVGDSSASALSAAVTWIMKEGTGMVGRILFAWWKGNGLDRDCKKWRFFADILNDAAMFIELCLPHFFTHYSMQVLCVTSAMKSIVGIAGGATRASITHHQAIKDNMAEISAKDGSQETVVNLIGSFMSIFLLNYFTSSRSEWILILSLMALHLYTNFLAVKCLIFKNFNTQRIALVLKTYFTIGTVLNPYKVNEKEVVVLGYGLKVKNICGFDIVLGNSLKTPLQHYNPADIKQLFPVYDDKKYLLFVCGQERQIFVCLEKGETTEDIIAAYFHAVCLAIATSIYNTIELDIYSKRQLHHPTPITRLYTYMKSYEKYENNFRNFPINYLIDFNEFVKQEHSMFFTALSINGWNITSNCLGVGEYRIAWKNAQNKKSL